MLAGDDGVIIVCLANGKQFARFKAHDVKIVVMCVMKEVLVILIDYDGTVHAWNLD